MNFDLSDEQLMLEETVERYLVTEYPEDRVRRIFDEPDDHLDLWQGLGRLGMLGIGLPPEIGGAGGGLLELAVIAEVLGRRAAPGPYIEHVLASLAVDAAGSDAQRSHWLPRLVSGAARATVAWPESGTDPRAWLPSNWHLETTPTLRGEKFLVPHARGADIIVVGTAGGGMALVEPDSTIEITRVEGLDRTRRLDHVTFDGTPCEPLPGGARAAARLLDAGLVLLAADAHGGAMAAVQAAVEYAKVRVQFGAPIGSFQAVQHQLADMALEIHPTRGLVWFAAHAWDVQLPDSRAAAANAKAHLADRYVDLTRRSVELHGGIGYTWDCYVHLWLKRALFDRAMLGDPRLHRARLADLVGW